MDGASKLVSGLHSIHQDLETEFADFIGSEQALISPSCYMANLGAITALVGRDYYP